MQRVTRIDIFGGGWLLFWGCPLEECEDEVESVIEELGRQLRCHKEKRERLSQSS